eukprot:gene5552-6914_t
MKDWVKDLPAAMVGPFPDQDQQQQQQQQQQQLHQPTSPPLQQQQQQQYQVQPPTSTPPTPPVRNYSIESLNSISSTTTTSTTSSLQQQEQDNKPKINIWSIMTGSDVQLVQSSANLQKLKSLWLEFQSSKSDKDKASRLNKLLPYFISLYEDKKLDVRSSNMVEIFGNNSRAFSFAVSRRLVKDLSEIWKQPAITKEQAAKDIYRYFSTCSGVSCGFELLYSIEILSESVQSCDAMAEAYIPSALVRSLQSFFLVQLSTMETHQGIIEDKIIKTLCFLSKQKSAIEELQKSDTLSIIFSLMSQECPSSHRPLRSKIVQFGLELTDLHPPTITYINSKKIIPNCIKGMSNFSCFTPETYISLCQMIIKILSESSKKSAILLDDFDRIEGYNFFVDSLLKLEQTYKDKPILFDQLLDSIVTLVYIGYGTIAIPESSVVPYQSSIPNIKEISNQVNIAKNENAFLVLEKYFIRSRVEENRLKILDRILGIYSSNLLNFIVLQHLNTLTKFIQEYESISNKLKQTIMKIVCFVVTVLNCIPFQELSTFSLLIHENPSQFTLEMVYQLITTLVNFEFRYKHIFREAGLLDILLKVIETISKRLLVLKESKDPDPLILSDLESIIKVESFQILLDSLYLLIAEHPDNISIIRKFSIFKTLIAFLPYSYVRGKSLRILQQLLKYDPDQSQKDFDKLIKMMTNMVKGNYQMKTDILNSIRKLFNISKYSRDSFREHGGFISIISLFISMESSFNVSNNNNSNNESITTTTTTTTTEQENNIEEKEIELEKLALIEAICRTTTSALCGNMMNREIFEQQIGYSTFSRSLIMTNVLSTEYSAKVVDYIFDMVTENLNGSDNISNRMIINNIEAFNVILDIIPRINNPEFVLNIVKHINKMAEYGRYNQEALSKLSIPDWILKNFPNNLSNTNDPLQPLLLDLIQTVGANCLTSSELRQFVKLLQPDESPEVLLKILCSMAKSQPAPPFFEFNLSKTPYGYIHMPIQDRTWPPTNGYTIMFWLFIEKSSNQIDLLHIYSEDKKSSLFLFLKNGFLNVHIVNNSKYTLELASYRIEEGKWYHIGIVHARRLLSGTDFKLFVDGFQRFSASKAQYPAQVPSGTPLYCDIGTSNVNRFPSDQIFRIGPFYLIEESLSSKYINIIYFLGPNYCSNFKGRFSPYQTYEIVNSQNLTAIRDLDYGDQLGPLNLQKVSMSIDENRIVIGLNASNKRIKTHNNSKYSNNDIINNILSDLAQGGQSINKKDNSISISSINNGGSTINSLTNQKDLKIEIINQADLLGRQKGILVGSVEAFRRNKVADGIKKIGGMPIALLLLEKANSYETLYDALGLLVGLIQHHPTNTHEMSVINGYELLAWVLRKKEHLINTNIVDLIFDLIGINGNTSLHHGVANRSEGTVANWNACKYIMMNYDIWKRRPIDLQRYVLQGYNDLIIDNVQSRFNAESLRRIHIIQEIFDILSDETVPEEVVPSVVQVLHNILSERLLDDDIRMVSTFLISGLHFHTLGQRSKRYSYRKVDNSRSIRTVNRVFQMFLHVVTHCIDSSVIFRRVSSYWCFYFIDENLPHLPVSLALRVTCSFFQLKHDYCTAFVKKSGFKLFERILPSLSGYHEIYLCLLHLMLGSDPKSMVDFPTQSSLEFHELLNIFKPVEKNLYCIESAMLILSLIKRSYEENYQYLDQYSNNNQKNNNNRFTTVEQSENEDLLSSLISASSLNSSTASTSSVSSTISPSLSSSQNISPPTITTTSTTTTSTPQPTTPSSSSHSVLSRVGSFLSKVEEKTLEFAGVGGLEDSSDGQNSMKKKRSSVSMSPVPFSKGSTANASTTSFASYTSTSSNNANAIGLSTFATPEIASNLQHTILTYFMYLFHENHNFQQECYSPKMIEYLISILFPNGRINLSSNIFATSVTGGTSSSGVKDRVLDLVLKFLCQIILSSLRKTSKAISIVELVLESTPLNVADEEFILYHTKIFVDSMYTIETNITKSEFFDSEKIHSNLVKLCTMMVDRVYLDVIVHTNKSVVSKRVFQFLVKILEKLEADRNGLKSVQPIYRSLNRIILYLINNGTDSELSFVTNHIINHQRIIFSDNNNDSDFVACLCYLLYQRLRSDSQESVDSATKLWKLLMSQKSTFGEILTMVLTLKIPSSTGKGTEVIDLRPGFDILINKDVRDFKIWVQDNISSINQVFEESPKRSFVNFQNVEKKNSNETLLSIKNHRKDRILKKEKAERKEAQNELEKQNHIVKKIQYFVKAESDRRKKIKQNDNDKQKFNVVQWENMRDQLTRERAVWGPEGPSELDKWKLDSTEGPYRMRKKMEKNYNFYKDYPYVPPSFDEKNNSLLPIPCSADSEKFLHIVGTDEEILLEPSYWRYDLPTTNQVISSSTNTTNIGQTTPNFVSQQQQQQLLQTTQQSSQVSFKSPQNTGNSGTNNEISPLQQSSTDISPPTSPIETSTDDLKSRPLTPSIMSEDENNNNTTTGNITQSNLFTFEQQELESNSSEATDLSTTPNINQTIGKQSQKSPSPSNSQQLSQKQQQPQDLDDDEEEIATEDTISNEEETQAFTRLLDPYDQQFLREEMRRDPRLSSVMYNCGSVDGMDKNEGILLFCPVNMYIFDGYAKDLNTGEISEVEIKINTEWLQEGTVIPTTKKVITHNCLKWAYDDVRDILKRRYLLRPVAMEIFSTDGRNNLIVFKDELTRDEVYHHLSTNVTTSSNNAIGGDASGISGSQTGLEDHHDQSMGVKEKITSIWRKSPLTLKWQQGQISNFQYLMHLNTLAGRTYNDLTQYPVFPWVLCDYTSDELDLDDLKVYRDLSKPMGALDETRAQKFIERFENWDDQEPNEHGHKVPKFHYGTHYSSAAIVLYYLIRLEPFTQHFLKLQSGRWDQADRLFSTIEEAWSSSSSGSTGVVMELIPEFYYLPEFLTNENKFNFGYKQGGEPIDSVVLPPWAKGSPQEFIRLHRKALESDYVSEHLHEWIDLIFGYKQQGKAAEDALNVFYYLTYEGAVNIDAITDPVEKAATISQINNFGQTPKQLFDKPHPKRATILNPLPFYVKTLVGNFIKDIGEPVGQIRIVNDRAQCVGFNKVLLPPNFSKYILWGLPDQSIRFNTGDKIKALEDHHDGPLTCLTTTDDGRICISGGSDSLICVYNLKRFSLVKRLCGHRGSITSVSASRPFSIIVSGSDDQTCIIWDLNRLRYVRTLLGHEGPISCIAVHDTTGEIVTCSGTTIIIYSVNGDLLLSFKTSQIIYDQITSCIWSKGPEWLGENVLITGHRDGKIRVWALESRLLPSIDSDPLSKLLIKLLLLQYIYPATFESVISPFFPNNTTTIAWPGVSGGAITLTKPEDQKFVTQLLGTNVPTGTSYLNNPDLMNFFGNSSMATMMAHFNCRESGKPSCEEYRFNSTKDICIMVGSVDGFDHVTIETNDPTVGWNTHANGSFSTTLPQCENMRVKEFPDKLSLGCFENTCQNPNFQIVQPSKAIDYVKICYTSNSASDYVFYAFSRCGAGSDIVTEPPNIVSVAATGTAFLDANGNGLMDAGDTPLANIPVRVRTRSGQPVRINETTTVPDATTDSNGKYILQPIPKGSYIVEFGFDPTRYSAATKSTSASNGSKINADFKTDPLILSVGAPGVVPRSSSDVGIISSQVMHNVNGGVVAK